MSCKPNAKIAVLVGILFSAWCAGEGRAAADIAFTMDAARSAAHPLPSLDIENRSGPGCPCNADIAPPGGSGVIDVDDLLAISNCLSGLSSDPACDVNCDGQVTTRDLGDVRCQFAGGGAACCTAPGGACCLPGPACIETSAMGCFPPGEIFFGVGTTCAGMACPECPCNADIEPAGGDGDVDVDDLFLIINCLSGTIDPACDVNCDGAINTRDLGDLRCQFAGGGPACCSAVGGACCLAGAACIDAPSIGCFGPAEVYLGDGSSCATTDTDGDGVADTCDNCLCISNRDQADSDNDGIGNACEACPCEGDIFPGPCGDGLIDVDDIIEVSQCLSGESSNPACDVNCDGVVNTRDLGDLRCQFATGAASCCTDPHGACCLPGGVTCIEAPEAGCGPDGLYSGDGTTCASTPCDCNLNEIPDACDLDCGPSGGACDLSGCGLSLDCNDNGRPDSCDIDDCTSKDGDNNGIPDECEPNCADIAPCGGNGIIDVDDILAVLDAFTGDSNPCSCGP